MDHMLCIHRASTTWHIHSQFSAMTSIATAVVLPAALTIANSSGYWVSQWQLTLLSDVPSLKDGLPHFTTQHDYKYLAYMALCELSLSIRRGVVTCNLHIINY